MIAKEQLLDHYLTFYEKFLEFIFFHVQKLCSNKKVFSFSYHSLKYLFVRSA